MDFYHKLSEAAGVDHILKDEPMSAHTTFRIGGPADYFVVPEDAASLGRGVALCRAEGVDYFITGNGSNLLVGDGGYRGVVFHICHTMDDVAYEEKGTELLVEAGAGVMLSSLARQVSSKGYTGFEYATGIPGTLGGGVTMNAGAYGGEISDNLLWAELMDETGAVLRLERDRLKLSYRHSVMMEQPLVVLRAGFSFTKGDAMAITEKVAELSRSRKEKQPLEYPSAGSTFKRPEGYFAGKLIQDCGLKGFRVGDAMVSEKHSGFVINVGHATAADVMTLIRHVQQEVDRQFCVRIEPEVRMIGEF
ncbi:UDP-N-acetylmuramate dehydrogenase [Coprococcus catus]|uniref:UDP-N-acetylmuramate dehydrogenase n=1 Tax=Coprococcus catus TaxID=116085 RepID=UPI001C8BFCDC|nr:UDP-N-acetylmuramate dehydrogenase [Coprococcus catus]MBX9232225.1 UDP-N-acetylmuramate dehydrogenase [Coprococcus catus]MCT6800911.1 UDP-N-acetylmuramate dehydrogenase [Coprococcus catus]